MVKSIQTYCFFRLFDLVLVGKKVHRCYRLTAFWKFQGGSYFFKNCPVDERVLCKFYKK